MLRQPFHEQTFTGGMKQDLDAHFQDPASYRYARNGRLTYNPSQKDKRDGKAMSFTNVPGNKLAMTLGNGYTIIGSVESRNGTILFSTNGVDSEIGIWQFDGEQGNVILPGAYRILYNDKFDPHVRNQPFRVRAQGESGQDRLNWRINDTIDAEVIYENELYERLYWTNRRGARHTLNLNDAPVNPAPVIGYYPKYWSAHAFRDRPDLVFPVLKLLGRGKGKLLSGAYQIAVQYRGKNGVRSVWSPITRRVPVSANPIDAYQAGGQVDSARQTALRANHHNRTMGASGVMTQESLRWQLKGLDVRWDEVVVAVLYFNTEGQPASVTTLKPVQLLQQTTITVDITQVEGEELTLAELNQQYETILKEGALATNNNLLIAGNLTLLKPVMPDVSAVQLVPKMQIMRADVTQEPLFESIPNPVTRRNDGDPITNSPVSSGLFSRQVFTGLTEAYTYTDDYANYKGQVFEWLYSGYFRGETYEFGVLARDRQGNPMFVAPIPAYTFPEQYAPGPNGEQDFYTLSKQDSQSGLYHLNLMGLSVSGIRIAVDSLLDEYGRLNISGFEIVRRKRRPTIAHQGVIVPGCFGPNCKGDQDQEDSVWPLPTTSNYFSKDVAGKPDTYRGQFGYYCWNGGGLFPGPNIPYPTFTRAYFGLYHSPDVLIEESLRAIQPGDVLHHIGVASAAYNTSIKGRELVPYTRHFYNKAIRTTTTQFPWADFAKAGRPNLGEITRLSIAKLHNGGFNETYREFDKDDLNQMFETQTHVYLDSNFQDYPYTDGLLQRNAVLMKMLDWVTVDIAESTQKPCSYRLVNYRQSLPEATEEEPYFSTGHFQPVTADTLNQANKIVSAGQVTHYEFNNIEVWGGDCYVNLFDFTRIYPYYSDGCDKRKDSWPDYSVSHVMPVESKYNLALRSGRSFAANATKPQVTSCEGSENQFSNGIMSKQPERWDYNRVLLIEPESVLYSVKPRESVIVSQLEDSFCWTPIKQSGQLLDAWRIRLAGNYGRVDGTQGGITGFVKSPFQGLYCYQTHGLCLLPLDAAEYRTNEAGTVMIQSGAVFRGSVPISKKYGTQHPDSIWSYNGQMGAWDARMGVFVRHSQAGLDMLSKTENINDLVKEITLPQSAVSDLSLRSWNCITGVDDDNDELLITISKADKHFTFVYSISLGFFTGEYDVYPVRYGNRGRLLFSVNPVAQNQLFIHNRGRYGEWFNVFFPTILRFIVAPAATINKTFDNAEINVTEEGSKRIVRIYHETPNGGVAQQHTLYPVNNYLFRFWNNVLAYPMHEEDWAAVKERLRDHYAVIEIEVENDLANIQVPITSFRTSYRITN